MVNVKVKRLTETAKLPTYGTEFAACMDLYADIPETTYIMPHATEMIGTGLSFELPPGYCAMIFARSGMATKLGLAPANKTGICDEDYRGEYMVALHNHSNIMRKVSPGDRIAQLMFVPYEQAFLEETDKLTETKRGTGGFGSTGK